MRALSLDPGKTTGYAICDIDNRDSIKLGWDQAKLDESALLDLLVQFDPTVVICEDFEYRNRARTGLDLTPVKLIGVTKLHCQKSNTKLIMQKAATGKAFWTDAKLKSFELYERGKPHGRDAERHLLHWLIFGQGYQYINEFKTVNVDIQPVELFN